MIQLRTADQLANAITKARTVKPRVKIDTFGSYTVENKETGATYNVICIAREGKRFVSCTCKAGTLGVECYHIAAAVSAHIQLASERRQQTH